MCGVVKRDLLVYTQKAGLCAWKLYIYLIIIKTRNGANARTNFPVDRYVFRTVKMTSYCLRYVTISKWTASPQTTIGWLIDFWSIFYSPMKFNDEWALVTGKSLFYISWQTVLRVCLTHRGRVAHICVSKLIIIGSDNGLSLGRLQGIIWTNAEILSILTLGTNFSGISTAINIFSITKLHLKCMHEMNAWNFIRQ